MSSQSVIFDESEVDEIDTQFQVIDAMNSGKFIDIVEKLCQNQQHMMSWIKYMDKNIKALATSFDRFSSKYAEQYPDEDSQVLVTNEELVAATLQGKVQVPVVWKLHHKHSFASVEVGGKTTHLMVDKSTRNALVGAQVPREATRIILKALHDIKDLRSMTRTGQKKRKSDALHGGDSTTEYNALPRETQLLVQEVWAKQFPLPELTNPTPEQVGDQKKDWIHKVNATISSVLQYYKDNYDDDGRIVKKKRDQLLGENNQNSEEV